MTNISHLTTSSNRNDSCKTYTHSHIKLASCYVYYTILYYTVLYYAILCYTILYYTIPYYTILYCAILCYAILCYTMLCYTMICCALYYTMLYYLMSSPDNCITTGSGSGSTTIGCSISTTTGALSLAPFFLLILI